ncbi:hypothetical protein CCACVL1_23377 [Corchorus capsularis]|uniref:Uncharacterized protein n=1 Tax=Corchorus capsularis TaxID=210143 RepID=A0A1R3GUD1_COCAP|nr:hypothetical protein CCACVL1_23377 [Corchorus capsularis]
MAKLSYTPRIYAGVGEEFKDSRAQGASGNVVHEEWDTVAVLRLARLTCGSIQLFKKGRRGNASLVGHPLAIYTLGLERLADAARNLGRIAVDSFCVSFALIKPAAVREVKILGGPHFPSHPSSLHVYGPYWLASGACFELGTTCGPRRLLSTRVPWVAFPRVAEREATAGQSATSPTLTAGNGNLKSPPATPQH